MSDKLRAWWLNCYGPDDKSFLEDKELATIDSMEDSISPLDDETAVIRQLITGFESCYHEADRQAELIIKAIGSGQAPKESDQRPPQRKRELQNSHDILSAWCEDTFDKVKGRNVGRISAEKLVSFIGNRTPLKVWQVRRVVDKVTFALVPSQPYHNMALDVGEYGEPGVEPVGQHYKDHSDLLTQTIETVIHDTIDGRKAQISLAIAIDRLQPCNWNFVDNLVIILKAIGGDLRPGKPLALCQRNIKLSPLCDRLLVIANTLKAYCQDAAQEDDVDSIILDVLGDKTPIKHWLAASLYKTVRLQLGP